MFDIYNIPLNPSRHHNIFRLTFKIRCNVCGKEKETTEFGTTEKYIRKVCTKCDNNRAKKDYSQNTGK